MPRPAIIKAQSFSNTNVIRLTVLSKEIAYPGQGFVIPSFHVRVLLISYAPTKSIASDRVNLSGKTIKL